MDKIINMVKENKKILLLLLIIIIIILMVILIPKADKPKQKRDIYYHEEAGIVKDEEYKGIEFTNISMSTEKGYTTFKATVTNKSDKDIETENVYINLKDKNNKVIVKLLGFIPDGLKKGESKKINSSIKGDYKNAYSKEITDYSVSSKG